MAITTVVVEEATPKRLTGFLLAESAGMPPVAMSLSLDHSPIRLGPAVTYETLPLDGNTYKIKFDIDLDSTSLRQGLEKYLLDHAGSDRSLDLSLTASLSGEEGDTHAHFPSDFRKTRTVAEWCKFFDIDLLSPDALPNAPVSSVTPATPNPGMQALPIAFYLPQFYPFEENDVWWGPGFTEWTSVSRSMTLFPDHNAPNIPSDLGYYDLRLRETREAQGKLAALYGIYGFCYYFYWFSGRRILEKGLELILREREPNLPFCLCWANESWTRRWDGGEHEHLIGQAHDASRDLLILDDLAPYFDDDRYIRIDGKPLLLIYRPALLADAVQFVSALRQRATEMGLPGLFLCGALTFGIEDPRVYGFDVAVEFPPHSIEASEIDPATLNADPDFRGKIFDMRGAYNHALKTTHPFPYFPGVMPRWDNSPRRGYTGHVFHHSSPDLFAANLAVVCRRTMEMNPSMPLVFINSWNEWGEGAHLEPDRRYGRKYLEALRRTVVDGYPYRIAEPSDDAHMEEDAVNSRKTAFLAHALSDLGVFSRKDKIYSGAPPVVNDLPTVPGELFNIESINGGSRLTTFIARQSGVYLRGWVLPSVRRDRVVWNKKSKPDPLLVKDDFLFVCLVGTDSREQYFSPVFVREHRPDVLVHYRLPDDGESRPGFVAQMDTTSVVPGNYRIGLLLVAPDRLWKYQSDLHLGIMG